MLLWGLVLLLGASGAGSANGDDGLEVTSPAFDHGGEIPEVHTCDGADRSPRLSIADAPSGTQTFALVMGDPDAPVPSPATLINFTHWVVWNVPADDGTATFPEDAIPAGAESGTNDFGDQGYGGPCPPHPVLDHRYFLTAFAVDTTLDLPEDATRSQLEAALEGHVLDEAALMGTYDRTYGLLPPGLT